MAGENDVRAGEVGDILSVLKEECAAARTIAEGIAARLDPDAALTVEVLVGGLTNDVYRASGGHLDVAIQVQMSADQSAALKIDRAAQRVASYHAATIGIGPEIVLYEDDPPVLVTRFIKSESSPVRSWHRDALERAAAGIAQLHNSNAGPEWQPFVLDAPVMIRRWLADSCAHYTDVHGAVQQALALVDEAVSVLPVRPLVPSHNDLMPGNIIDDGDKVWIIDWEWAALNVAAHDYANFIRLNELNDRELEIFLEVADMADATDRACITIYRALTQLWEAAYILMCGAVGFLDIDHAEFFSASVSTVATFADSDVYRDAVCRLTAASQI
ncbi:phosphotransferase (plasmid) [Mycobacterium sp. TJFP1]